MLWEIDNTGKQSVTTPWKNPGVLTQIWHPTPSELDSFRKKQAQSQHQPQMIDFDTFVIQTMTSCYGWKKQIEESNQRQQHQQAQSQHQPLMIDFDAFVLQTWASCDGWKKQIEQSNQRAAKVEQQFIDAWFLIRTLKDNLVQLSSGVGDRDLNSYTVNDLRGYMLPKLRCVQAKLRGQLEAVDNALYLETAVKCMQCETNNRSVTLVACNHFVLCGVCATTQRECPYCYTPVTYYVRTS